MKRQVIAQLTTAERLTLLEQILLRRANALVLNLRPAL